MGKKKSDVESAGLTVSRVDLRELAACQLGHETFATRFDGIKGASFDAKTETWTLERGWTDDVTAKLAAEAPVSLRWYVRHGYAPADCGWREAIAKAQGSPAGARTFISHGRIIHRGAGA